LYTDFLNYIYVNLFFIYCVGSLYTLGGFQLPFYVLGALMLVTLPFNLSLLPATQPTLQKNLGSKVLLIFKIPAVFIVCLVVAVSSSAWYSTYHQLSIN